eukprot:1853852-Amphidinium_carterae.1
MSLPIAKKPQDPSIGHSLDQKQAVLPAFAARVQPRTVVPSQHTIRSRSAESKVAPGELSPQSRRYPLLVAPSMAPPG